MTQKNKVLIAMSGGVDSTIAAKLMIDRGYNCIGCTMQLHDHISCGSLADTTVAKEVTDKLGIPYHIYDYREDFASTIVDGFVCAYESGQTPNPCIKCNKYMKFGKLYDEATRLGCEYIVTGHYARIDYDGTQYLLKKAVDETKDQSYVLYNLSQSQLAHTLFPLGELSKSSVREIARANGYTNADKPDSQDICFVPDGDYASFICKHTGKEYEKGFFLDTSGNILGMHNGIVNYTIGQRKGLGISYPHPLYVKKVDVLNNAITLSSDADLYSNTLIADNFNWTISTVSGDPIVCNAKIRYRHKEQPAIATIIDDKRVKVVFDDPQRAITPGQAVVLYDGDIVLGGGTIV